jgi:hypothetical protein
MACTAWSAIPYIAGRHVFYNDSAFDDGPAANEADDGAIAPDKTPLLPGQTAQFAHYTSYSLGFNGLMVDIMDLPGAPGAGDFIFQMGNAGDPTTWPLAPAPADVQLRAGAGADGSTRITIVWDAHLIQGVWLRVTVLATPATGLPVNDVFYIGNAIGESGDSDTDALVDPADQLLARNNPHGPLDPAPIDDPYDYNRDRLVNSGDQLIARNNVTGPLSALLLITPPLPPASMGIASVDPPSGLPGTLVTINGFGFDPDPYNNIVTIGGSACRIVSGHAGQLRVIALRDLATGLVKVQKGADSAFSLQLFERAGTTTMATPLADSDAELTEGLGYDVDRRYDMMAQGLNQKLLVVLATPNDINPEDLAPVGLSARDAILAKLADANTYFLQASYNKASAAFTVTANWLPLSQSRDFYCWQQDDIDRAQAQVDAAQAALDALMLDPDATQEQIDEAEEDLEEANEKKRVAQDAQGFLQEPDFAFAEALVQAKAAIGDFDTYSDYVLIMAGPFLRGANLGTKTGYHAESTILAIEADIDFVEPKGITYFAQGADWGRVVHEVAHFFAGGDLYSQSSADGSFVEGLAAPYAMMGNHDSHPLFIGANMEKRLDYFDESVSGNVEFIEWGSVADYDDTIDVVAHAVTEDPTGDDVRHLIRMKVTDGLTYYVEVRQRPDSTFGPEGDYIFDTNIPLDPSNPAWEGGVIITKSVENNNQSNNKERPINLLPPFRMMQVGDFFEDPERTIRIDVVDRIADRPAKYSVRVRWGHLPAADPNGQFDLRITPWGAPPWETVDIWANSPKNDETMPAQILYKNHEPGDETKPVGNGDPPWVGHDNTLFARITNQGVIETPEDVLVTFYVNTPPGVGDDGNWAPFDTVNVGKLMPNQTVVVEATRKWRPAIDEHTCVKVQIHERNGEITFDNNQAQENFSEFETGAASPYAPVEFTFLARNPYDAPAIMDLHARGLPELWYAAFDRGSVYLPPLSNKPVHVVIWTDRTPEWLPDHQDKSPQKVPVSIEGWMQVFGNKSFAVGGITALVAAVRVVDIDIDPTLTGETFVVRGQVNPPAGIVPIAVHFYSPSGQFHSDRTQTTAGGSFSVQSGVNPHIEPGPWKIQALILEGSLAHSAESEVVTIDVP